MASASPVPRPKSSLGDSSGIRDQMLTVTESWLPECSGPVHEVTLESKVICARMT
jgi:hypothetical protein